MIIITTVKQLQKDGEIVITEAGLTMRSFSRELMMQKYVFDRSFDERQVIVRRLNPCPRREVAGEKFCDGFKEDFRRGSRESPVAEEMCNILERWRPL